MNLYAVLLRPGVGDAFSPARQRALSLRVAEGPPEFILECAAVGIDEYGYASAAATPRFTDASSIRRAIVGFHIANVLFHPPHHQNFAHRAPNPDTLPSYARTPVKRY